jgi:hypothetical protein
VPITFASRATARIITLVSVEPVWANNEHEKSKMAQVVVLDSFRTFMVDLRGLEKDITFSIWPRMDGLCGGLWRTEFISHTGSSRCAP